MEEKIKIAELLFPDNKYSISEIENMYKPRDLNDGAMVTRLGPSPTGFIHMGSLYGSFIDKTFANQTNGVFFLRIEDTDSKREVEGGVEGVFNDLNTFNLTPDEGESFGGNYGPYKQSLRNDIYHSYIKKMIIDNKAYPCFMSEKELEAIREEQEINKTKFGIYGHYATDRDLSYEEIENKINNGESYVIRLKSFGNPNNTVVIKDAIKGDITFPENDIDYVLIKKDKTPVYHFAHVCDDYLMKTTHVIRGDEWLSSTPVHYQIFNYLNLEKPIYAHHGTVNKIEDGKTRKISKRKDPEAKASYYEEQGIPVEALHLYLATIMNTNFEEWYLENPTKGISDFTFTFDKIPVSGTLFDLEKLMNISKTYFSTKNTNDIYEEALIYTEKFDKEFNLLMKNNKENMIKFLNIEKDGDRVRKDIAKYSDIKEEFYYAFDELFEKYAYLNIEDKYDTELLSKYIDSLVLDKTKDEWFMATKEFAINNGFAPNPKTYKKDPDSYIGHVGTLCEALRVVVTGKSKSPDLYEILTILGIDKIKERLKLYKNIEIGKERLND